MMRYRSARIVPGVKPPTGIESEGMRRASLGADAAAAVALPVGISERGVIGCPQEGQNLLPAAMSAEHEGHWIPGGVMDTEADYSPVWGGLHGPGMPKA